MTIYCESPAQRIDWETPQYIFDALDAEFHFTTDVCALPRNAKCAEFYTPEQDGLTQKWTGVCWMNPPYGSEVSIWVEKAYLSAKSGAATVVCLLPVRSNNEWWKYVIEGEVRFIRKKLRFVGASSVSMFPNAVVVFRPDLEGGGRMSIWKP